MIADWLMQVFTRLPCSDHEFSNGSALPGPFLSEVMASVGSHATSPLSECIVLMTICSRALAHKQVTDMEVLCGNSPREFTSRHDWLNSLLTSRLNSLKANYPPASFTSDPMIIFAHLVARTAIIYLCHIMEPLSKDVQTFSLVSNQQDRAVWAAQDISRLAGELENIGYFKAHTFTSLPIYLSAAKLRYHLERQKTQLHSSHSSVHKIEESLKVSLGALRKLRSVNNLANYYLHMVEADNINDICFRLE